MNKKWNIRDEYFQVADGVLVMDYDVEKLRKELIKEIQSTLSARNGMEFLHCIVEAINEIFGEK